MSREVLVQLADISRSLTEAVDMLGHLEELHADAEADYKLAEAEAYMTATGPVEERKRKALIATDAQFRHYRKAEAAVRKQREHIKALHSRIDVGRTVQATERTISGVAS